MITPVFQPFSGIKKGKATDTIVSVALTALVELTGLEPVTPTLPVLCAPSCAIAPSPLILLHGPTSVKKRCQTSVSRKTRLCRAAIGREKINPWKSVNGRHPVDRTRRLPGTHHISGIRAPHEYAVVREASHGGISRRQNDGGSRQRQIVIRLSPLLFRAAVKPV